MGAIPKRRCIFCDGPAKLTKEHLWSKWTRQLVQYDSIKHEYANQVFNRGGTDRTAKITAGDVRNRGLRAVCGDCNSGWMSAVEERAKPTLEALIRGAGAFLNHDSQKTVTTWIAMKAMVAEFFDPSYAAIPLLERQFLNANRLPPDNWKIWIGNYKRGSWAGQWAHSASGLASPESVARRKPETPNTQTSTLIVGQLYCHAFSSEIRSLVDRVQLGETGLAKLPQIWPVRESFVAWPTGALSDADASDFASKIFTDLRR